VSYTISWNPAADAWRVAAPAIDQPEWANARLRSAIAREEGDTTTIEYVLDVVAHDEGDYEIPALEFGVYDSSTLVKNETADLKEPPPVWEPAATLAAEPLMVQVQPDYRPWIATGTLIGLAVLLVLVAGTVMYRRRPAAVSANEPAAHADPIEHVHAARKYRLDGDFYQFYQSLVKAAGLGVGPEAVRLSARLKERAREVGYGGGRPTDDELDAAIKDVEKCVTASRGDA
jgi:hypothetical protein